MDKVEILPAIDLMECNGPRPAHGGGSKSGGNCGDDGSGFLTPSSIRYHHLKDTYPPSVAWTAAVANTPASNRVL